MHSSPLVTIFVPVYKTRPYVEECLDSVFSLEGGYDLEILIIDDASPDGSGELIKRYTKDNRVRFIQHEVNLGGKPTWNEGFHKARGKYVARIDSDDRYRSDFLTKTVPILEGKSEVGLVYGDIALINSLGEITSEENNIDRFGQPHTGNELKAILTKNYIPTPTTLARKEAWMLSIPLPGWLSFGDWYQSVMMAMEWDFAYVDEVLADYRVHAGNRHSEMIRDRTGEKTTFRVIEDVFGTESQQITVGERRRILAMNYQHYGDSYFGAGMWKEARRCYFNALKHGTSLNPALRRLIACYFPDSAYKYVKKILQRKVV